MTWLWILLAAFGGGVIGWALGAAWGLYRLDEAQTVASNTAIAVFATTAELTYGEEWLHEFIAEANTIMEDHPDMIIQKATQIRVNQAIAQLRRNLEADRG